MAKFDLKRVWTDIVQYRRAYVLTAVASFGGMLFGWDTGLIGGVLTMDAFQHSFNLNNKSPDFANLQGNIVSVLQAGCFFGALSSFYISDTFGRKKALIIADIIFLVGSLVQTLCAIHTASLAQLYVGRVIGGFGVGLVSAVVPTYIGENANKEIRGRCIGCMQLFNVTGICLSFFVNYGISLQIKTLSSAKWRIPFALQMLPGACLLVGIIFQNESPRWLVEKDRLKDAAKALARVRAKPVDDVDVIQELDEIIRDFQGHEKLPLTAQLRAACSSKRMLYQSSFAVILMLINYYAPQIFQSIGLKGNSAGLFATGVYGIVKIVVTAIGLMAFTEQLGRKVFRSLIMAAALMTQWLFNFVIAKITPLMLSGITYGTFLLFGTCCIIMGIYTVFCVPETKNVPLESIHHLFEGNIMAGCVRDTIPRHSRAKELQHHHITNDDASETSATAHKGVVSGVQHVEDA
ncbi:hypothetical protein SLS60_004548 [Paraconiothyrium brasiliense]|uniref:Major facilitator superfamily (MFS) profile domain-containing protein n=1 Tax=Paraconiothyrium brasiliense TaxID=300254 RepID=A0ABR3RKN6_9PLEO